ncbi:hypothetical protein ACYOEI_29680 [Singulisphaera rosea]
MGRPPNDVVLATGLIVVKSEATESREVRRSFSSEPDFGASSANDLLAALSDRRQLFFPVNVN